MVTRKDKEIRDAVLGCLLALAAATPIEAQAPSPAVDVVGYELQLEPDLTAKSVKGVEVITFVVGREAVATAAFDAGTLVIDDVRLGDVLLTHRREGPKAMVDFGRRLPAGRYALSLRYRGTPSFGIRFYPDPEQIYTVFSTSQWMVCVDSPAERARFALDLRVPAGWEAVANGRELEAVAANDGHVTRRFRLDRDAPSYTYGFAAGAFRRVVDSSTRLPFVTVAPRDWSDRDLHRVLRETPAMLRFFEARAGVAYPDGQYVQVLAAGNPQQEMSGFSIMPETWGQRVLAGDADIVLAAHELAHQWWGNLVTNAEWTHLWLNEGMATFMAAAYVESRSGREGYERLIAAYRTDYEQVRAAGRDKPLEFDSWDRPTADDRTLVYRKGAYVLHLLRGELGDEAFWAGLKAYTQEFAGRSVVSRDFQRSLERSSGRDLSAFFGRWVLR